ncbi:MAG: VWA domain-containing protein [Bacteroidales bacterium]|nr:VWA domain-containing protein [Bacteroidales bacterium]
MKRFVSLGILFALLSSFMACSTSDWPDGSSVSGRYGIDVTGLPGPGEPSGPGSGTAGVLTAGEWSDLAHWDYWGGLMTAKPGEPNPDAPQQAVPDYGKMAADWGFNTASRYALHVQDASGKPVVGATVELLESGTVVWKARTSNAGDAQLWYDLFAARGQERAPTSLQIRINGVLQETAPVVTTFTDEAKINTYVASTTAPEARADVAFIVDATGSMGDEIAFLKEDLLSILERVAQSQESITIRTAAVFYRDKIYRDTRDSYLTRYDDFTTPAKTSAFVRKQDAEGGGDLPEAVHSGLETSIQNLSWNTKARARLAFLLLDAPAHIDHQGVVESLQASIRTYSEMGIRLIPVLASTSDKSTEFMCRDFAIVTGGTYTFLTDDSGVGNRHLVPTVGEFQVEKLNDLLFRLIEDYIK